MMAESRYQSMQEEILSLQRRLLGTSEALSGKAAEYRLGNRSRLKRLTQKS